MKEFLAKVLSNNGVGKDLFILCLDIGERLKREVRSGQFAMVGSGSKNGSLLRRPYSIYDVKHHKSGTRLYFCYKAVGKGTSNLAACMEGEKLSLLAPLGNGFDLNAAKGKTVCVVTGGIGFVPFCLFLRQIRSHRPAKIYVFYGAREKGELFGASFFRDNSDKLFISTDDGSRGYRGFVTGLFENSLKLSKELSVVGSDRIITYTCGPRQMMRTLSGYCEGRGIPCHASMEEVMGCGFGACLSCVVKPRDEGKIWLAVCKDGPCFDSRDIRI